MTQQELCFPDKLKPRKRPLRNIMFDVAASIETRKTFDELTIDEMVSVMRKRLAEIKRSNESESFGYCDEYEVEELPL
jgi:hypothetical protein